MSLDTPIFCETGPWIYAGRELKDDEAAVSARCRSRKSWRKSSNIGFAKIGAELPGRPSGFINTPRRSASASAPNLFGDQSESRGLLRPVSSGAALSVTRIPMGQEVARRPIQMVTAMSVIANGGKLIDAASDQAGHRCRRQCAADLHARTRAPGHLAASTAQAGHQGARSR